MVTDNVVSAVAIAARADLIEETRLVLALSETPHQVVIRVFLDTHSSVIGLTHHGVDVPAISSRKAIPLYARFHRM